MPTQAKLDAILSLSLSERQGRYLKLSGKVANLIALTTEELEELVLLREALRRDADDPNPHAVLTKDPLGYRWSCPRCSWFLSLVDKNGKLNSALDALIGFQNHKCSDYPRVLKDSLAFLGVGREPSFCSDSH